jgi:hypothetical protein
LIELKNTPINTIISIEGPLVTLECVCGRPFTLKDGVVTSTRCEVCLEFAENIPELSPKEFTELATFMHENVFTEYTHKLNRV